MKIIEGPESVQKSDAWLAYRRAKIMASEIAAIMGKSPWSSAEEVFYEKLGLGKERVVNENMKRGINLEPVALAALNEQLGTEFKPCVVESTEHPWLGASLDGHWNGWICELKAGGEKAHTMTKNGIIPEYYQLQMQQQLLVSGAEMCFFANYFEGDLSVIEVRPDPAMQGEILDAAKEFWQRVQDLDPPEPKYIEREEQEWLIAVSTLNNAQRHIKIHQEHEAEAKATLIQLSDGRNSKGYGIGVIHSARAGSIDYAKLCESNKIDASKYRKPATKVVTVRNVK